MSLDLTFATISSVVRISVDVIHREIRLSTSLSVTSVGDVQLMLFKDETIDQLRTSNY